jgi:hypothetical protein
MDREVATENAPVSAGTSGTIDGAVEDTGKERKGGFRGGGTSKLVRSGRDGEPTGGG